MVGLVGIVEGGLTVLWDEVDPKKYGGMLLQLRAASQVELLLKGWLVEE